MIPEQAVDGSLRPLHLTHTETKDVTACTNLYDQN